MFEAIDRDVPGFGGLYLDENQNPVIAIVAGTSHAAAEAAVRAHMGRVPGRAGGAVQYVSIAYRFSDLRRWLREFGATWRRDGMTMMDVNERRNRIVIGVRDGAVRNARSVSTSNCQATRRSTVSRTPTARPYRGA